MSNVDSFILGFLLSASLCLDLGVVNLALFQTGLQRGGWAAFALGAGSTFGDLCYALLATYGMALLLGLTWLRYTLWLGGTVLLLYLAWRLWQQAADALDYQALTETPEHRSLWPLFGRGWLLALSSPSAILWFASVGGTVMATSLHGAGAHTLLSFYGGFFSCGLLYSATVATLIHQGRHHISQHTHLWLNRVSAALFVLLALKVAYDGAQQWL